MDENQKDWLTVLGLLEVLGMFGIVKYPNVIPFTTKSPGPKIRASS
jgi:hypothetical protein